MALTEAKRKHYEKLLEFVRLANALSELPSGTLWAVGNMEEGPFARLCWPMPNGGYTGGYVEANGETPALALRAAIGKACCPYHLPAKLPYPCPNCDCAASEIQTGAA